jgi:hypothetical protein
MMRARRVGRSRAAFPRKRSRASALLVSNDSEFGGDGSDAEFRSDGSEECERAGKNSSAKERADGCQLMRIRSEGDGGDAGRAGGRFRSRPAHLRGIGSGSEKLRLGLSGGEEASG